MSGISLARDFYCGAVRPLIGDVSHAAALLGDGSEVLGYDDETSADHSFGPRLQLFLDDPADCGAVESALQRLPQQFGGFSVSFPYVARHGGAAHHQVEVTTADAYFTGVLGVDPLAGMTLADWLLTPTQRFATLTAGAVFHDPLDVLGARRRALAWYPDDVWRYVLAAGWLRVSQEEAFIGRTGGRGDELGSAIVGARVVRDLVRLAFLVSRAWEPYSKWLGRAFAELPIAHQLQPQLMTALHARDWRERENAICAAGAVLGAATNALQLAEATDPSPRQFYDRDIRVVDGWRFTEALTAAVTDPDVRAHLDRLGQRAGASIGALPGAIDQAVDSVDVLGRVDRCRSAAPLLGLPRLGS